MASLVLPRSNASGSAAPAQGGAGSAWTPLPEGEVYRLSSKPEPLSWRRQARKPQVSAPATTAKSDTFAVTTTKRRGWKPSAPAIAVVVLFLTLMAATASLYKERQQSGELAKKLAGLQTTADHFSKDLAQTRLLLAESEKDRGMMIDALRGSIKSEKSLREDVADWQILHAEERANKTKAVESWSTYGNKLASVVEQTNALREQEHTEATEQVAQLEDKTHQLNQVNQNLSRTAAEWQNSAEQLDRINRSLQSDLERAKSCLASLESENRSLQSCNLQLSSQISSLDSCISGLRSTICSLEARIRCLESELSNAKSGNGQGHGNGQGRGK